MTNIDKLCGNRKCIAEMLNLPLADKLGIGVRGASASELFGLAVSVMCPFHSDWQLFGECFGFANVHDTLRLAISIFQNLSGNLICKGCYFYIIQ